MRLILRRVWSTELARSEEMKWIKDAHERRGNGPLDLKGAMALIAKRLLDRSSRTRCAMWRPLACFACLQRKRARRRRTLTRARFAISCLDSECMSWYCRPLQPRVGL